MNFFVYDACKSAYKKTLKPGQEIGPLPTLFFGGLAGAAAQFVVSILRPSDIRPSWDEQVQASHRASLVFGYWITLATFLVFLALVLADVMSVDLAFYALGFPLGFAPAVWMLGAHLAGRAG